MPAASALSTNSTESVDHPAVWDGFDGVALTPASTSERGCQLSVHVTDHPRRRFDALMDRGIICDFREPDVIRLAPTPLYNRFVDVFTAAEVLGES